MPKHKYALTDTLGQPITRESAREYLYAIYRVLEGPDGTRTRNFTNMANGYSLTIKPDGHARAAALKRAPLYPYQIRDGLKVISAHALPTQFGLALNLPEINL